MQKLIKKDKYHIINGNLNSLGCTVLKSDIMMEDKNDNCFAKLSIIKSERHWQKLINTDSQRSILFPCDYLRSRFGYEDISFFVLQSKILNYYDATIKHLNEEYGLSKVGYIKCIIIIYFVMTNTLIIIYKNHRDFNVGIPNNVKKKLPKKTSKNENQFSK